MEFKHTSVLLKECIENLNIKEDGIYVDGTMGGAGHSKEICSRLSEKGIFIGIDQDLDAINVAKERLAPYKCKKYFIHDNYSNIVSILQNLEIDGIDGALLDIGVSSFQLDNAQRGFSYMNDANLDMRMNRELNFSAYNVINEYSEDELNRIIKDYGEERWSRRIAKFIVEERKSSSINTTYELVEVIKKAIPSKARREGPHPAKRTFQAIRIEVNDELGQLEVAVNDFIKVLNEEGRLAIITFHSLEDRIVKNIYLEKENSCICPPELPICTCNKKREVKRVNRKPIIASKCELEENHRSRSAKLRVCKKVF